MPGSPSPSSTPRAVAGLLVTGWLLHDLAIAVASGDPADLARLLSGSLGALALALLADLARTRFPRLPLAVLATADVAALLTVGRPGLSAALRWLPRTTALLALAWWLCGGRPARWKAPATALATGAVAAALQSALRGTEIVWAVVLPVALASLAPLLPRRATRIGAAALGIVLAAVLARRFVSFPTPQPRFGPPPTSAPSEEAPNLVLIVLDTVRADHLAAYGHERDTLPRLEAFFAERGTCFEAARATSSWTLASHGSLFTGLLPSEHGASIMGPEARPLRADRPTLAERLRAAGRDTAAVVANCAYFHPRLGLDRGFDHYDNRPGGWTGGHLFLAQLAGGAVRAGNDRYRRAPAIADAALAWLERRASRRPFFLFLNFMDAHDPLLPPADLRPWGSPDPVDPLRPRSSELPDLYDRSLALLDREVTRVLEGLERHGLLDRTAVVLTSDHGEGLGDRGFRGHGRHLHDELLHVPLFVRPARGSSPARLSAPEAPLSGADVHGLLCDLAGIAPPPADGPPAEVSGEWRFLRDEDPARRAHYEALLRRPLDRDLVTWIEGGWKWIVASDGRARAFDLGRDPGEREPLVLSPVRVLAAQERAERWWRDHPPPPSSEAVPAAGEQELGLLRRLGYAGE